jgi:RNA polymerase sigma factor (sigma-70 family)
MALREIPELLRLLSGADSSLGWEEFLAEFSPILQQVIVLSATDPDTQGDCFVFVCEQLARNRFRRLRKFDCSGRASFATWLRAVVRNLCIDWHRKNGGRFRPFGWVSNLGSLDQHVFRCVYEQHRSIAHTFACLAPVIPGLTVSSVEESADRLAARLSPRERWLLSSRQVRVESLDTNGEDGFAMFDIPDLMPDPEHASLDRERYRALAVAISALPPDDQLLLRLRFEQDLTLAEIARVAGLKDAQTADRKIRTVLDQVRGRMAGFSARLPGKAKTASV